MRAFSSLTPKTPGPLPFYELKEGRVHALVRLVTTIYLTDLIENISTVSVAISDKQISGIRYGTTSKTTIIKKNFLLSSR